MIYVVGTGFKPVPTEIGKCFFEIKKQFVEKLGKIKIQHRVVLENENNFTEN